MQIPFKLAARSELQSSSLIWSVLGVDVAPQMSGGFWVQPKRSFLDTAWGRLAIVMACGGALALAQEGAQLRTDYEIWRDIRSLYSADERLHEVPLNLHVDDGEVRVSGTVKETQQHETALRLARSVMGVEDVVDQIIVTPQYELGSSNEMAGRVGAPGETVLDLSGRAANRTIADPWAELDAPRTIRGDSDYGDRYAIDPVTGMKRSYP